MNVDGRNKFKMHSKLWIQFITFTFGLSFNSLTHAFEDPDFSALCKEQLGRNEVYANSSIEKECGITPKNSVTENKMAMDKFFDEAYSNELFKEVSKEMRMQEQTAVGLKNCFLSEKKQQPNNNNEPAFCHDQQKMWSDSFGNASPSCCHEILSTVRKSMARSAFRQRVHNALANITFPSFETAQKNGEAFKSFEDQIAAARKENRLSADEALYLKRILENSAQTMEGLAKNKGEAAYDNWVETTRSSIKAKSDFFNKIDDLANLQPPEYSVSAETGVHFFEKQASEKAKVTIEFSKGGLSSQVRICAMRKFVDVSVAVVKRGTKRTGSNEYCKAADRLAVKCKDYENDIFTQLSTPLGEAGFGMVVAGMAVPPLAPFTILPGLIIGEVSSFSTLRDELLYSETDQLHLFGNYQGDKETSMMRFLNVASSVPNFGSKLMSAGSRKFVWHGQFVEGEIGARLDSVDGMPSTTLNVTDESSVKQISELAKSADSFKSKNKLSQSEQIIYDQIVAGHFDSRDSAKTARFQNNFNHCIEAQFVKQPNFRSPVFYNCESQNLK